MSSARQQRNKGFTVLALVGVLGVMFTLVSYSVPLYRLFCQVTGYGGTTSAASALPEKTIDRTVNVRFNADTNRGLPWRFEAPDGIVTLKLGEEGFASFTAKNVSDEPIVGTAVFNVTPQKAGYYFTKIACFCFTEQRLDPGEVAEMPVSFFVDPSITEDRNLDDVKTITLSYTFYRKADDQPDPARVSQAPAAARTVN